MDILKCPFLKILADFCFLLFLENRKLPFCDCYALMTEIVIHNYAVEEFGRNRAISARFLFFFSTKRYKEKILSCLEKKACLKPQIFTYANVVTNRGAKSLTMNVI
jgi:hypothetical protein